LQLEKKQKAYEGDARMFSQRMFGGASKEDDESPSKVTKNVLTENLISVAHDNNLLNI